MGLLDLDDPEAVESALDEFDRLGRASFLARYNAGPASGYFVVRKGRHYDSKAIAAAAHGFQFGEPLEPQAFSGGAATVAPKLRSLGFEIRGPGNGRSGELPNLDHGRVYTWDKLGKLFDFRPNYLNRVGGMLSRPKLGALLLITHPGGGKSFDYGDYWDGEDLIYTGRGQIGDQHREGPNRDVGENARALLVFESEAPREVRFLGEAACVDEWIARAPDRYGTDRSILRFRLRFNEGQGRVGRTTRTDRLTTPGREPEREPRPFDRNRAPRPRQARRLPRSPEETLALQEKAAQGHHALLVRLLDWLRQGGCQSVEEIPAAIDLWATLPVGKRVIFEAKTVSSGSELARTRAGAAQLLEYRFFFGEEDDSLCLVTDRPISDRRCRFLDSLGIATIWANDGRFVAGSSTASAVLAGLGSG